MCAGSGEREILAQRGITVIESNLIDISDGMVRHDADRIANILPDDDPRSIAVFADLLKPGVIRESYEGSAGETVGTFVRARPLLQKRKQANPAGDRLFLGKCDLLFFLKVEHSVSAQHVQSERMPFWLVTLIVSAVHSSSAKWTHSETLHFTFVLLI